MRDRLGERFTLVFRTSPEAARARLESFGHGRFTAALRDGFGLVEVVYSRLESARAHWWSGHSGPADLLTVGIPVLERRSERRGSVLLAQLRTPWLERFATPRGSSTRPRPASFTLESGVSHLELAVSEPTGQALSVRAQVCPGPRGSTFLSARAAAEHFGRSQFQTPRPAYAAPSAEQLLASGRWALDTLAVFDLRLRLLEELELEAAEFDSAFRLTRLRRVPLAHPQAQAHSLRSNPICLPGT